MRSGRRVFLLVRGLRCRWRREVYVPENGGAPAGEAGAIQLESDWS